MNEESTFKKMRKERVHGRVWRMVFFPLFFAYLELMFHLMIFKGVEISTIYPVIFGAMIGVIVGFITSLFKGVGNAIAAYICMTIGCVYCISQLIYNQIFGSYFSFVSVGGAADAMDFKSVLFDTIGRNILNIFLLLVPLITLIVFNVFFVSFHRRYIKKKFILSLEIVGGTVLAAILSLFLMGTNPYTPHYLFFKKYVMELSVEKLGIFVNTAQDFSKYISGGNIDEDKEFELVVKPTPRPTNTPIPTPTPRPDISRGPEITLTPTPTPIVYKPHVDESLDLAQIYETADTKAHKNLTAYFSGKEPTLENEYTGMFKDYNVVYITAESLSRYAITKEAMPTLYKIMNEGFVFENFYNPKWYNSTIDGEFVNCLSQYPCDYDWSFYKSAKTYQPYALGNALNKLGYTSLAYHDYNYYYYDRSQTHTNMGYDFKALDFGLKLPYNYPYSDFDTMVAVMDEITSQDKFNMYFMTFSGHLPYNTERNTLAKKNFEDAKKLSADRGLSRDGICYIAGQLELEKAVAYLCDQLAATGKLDKTLFIVTSDHYPYALYEGSYNKLAGGVDVEHDKFELHHAPLGIWNPKMEGPVKVDKLCASVDILPTVLNLLGVEYDSRFLAGNDIFSDKDGLVIYADHSFMTDKIQYNTSNGKMTKRTEEELPENYLKDMIDDVENRLYISDTLITSNYFKYIYPDGE